YRGGGSWNSRLRRVSPFLSGGQSGVRGGCLLQFDRSRESDCSGDDDSRTRGAARYQKLSHAPAARESEDSIGGTVGQAFLPVLGEEKTDRQTDRQECLSYSKTYVRHHWIH